MVAAWMQGVISDNNESLDGSFVIMLLDANNKPTKYWVLQNETVDLSKGLISFDEKDGQTIHLHGNVIIKEFDDVQTSCEEDWLHQDKVFKL